MQTDLYRHFDASGRLLYVGVSLSAIGRLRQHRRESHWSSEVATVMIEKFPTRADALRAERNAIIRENPKHNTIRRPERPTLAESMRSIESTLAAMSADEVSALSEQFVAVIRNNPEIEWFRECVS